MKEGTQSIIIQYFEKGTVWKKDQINLVEMEIYISNFIKIKA